MLTIFIKGKPQGKGRARAHITKRGKIGHYTPEKTRTYESLIKREAAIEMGPNKPTRRPVSLSLVLNYPTPASWPQWKVDAAINGDIMPTVKPDADNVVKAVKDAFNGVVWHDDCQVVLLDVQKKYSTNPGVLATVTPLAQYQANIKTKTELEGAA